MILKTHVSSNVRPDSKICIQCTDAGKPKKQEIVITSYFKELKNQAIRKGSKLVET
jgi:hypothetical protein